MKTSGVTVVVPVWNHRELLAPLWANLMAQTERPVEVIVVDDGSTDGAGAAAAALGARVIAMDATSGFARAVNRGISACRTEWVAVLNNDVKLAPDYLAVLLAAAQASGAGFATGKLRSASDPNRIDATFDLVSRGGCSRRAGHGELDGPAFSARRSIYSAPWTAVLFRKALFKEVGGLEESFESYLEDVEFGVRCARHDFAGLYVPEAVGWHQGSATLGVGHPDTVRRMARNQLLLAARHFPWRFLWPVLVAQLGWGLVTLRQGRFRPWLAGIAAGIAQFRKARRAYSSIDVPALESWLRANERELRRAPSRYWRVYSLLTGTWRSDT
jgi:GT2 family glycosyltransferase